MDQLIANALHDYGPLAVFMLLMLSGFGLALGEDLVVVPAGAMIAKGYLPLWETAVAVYAGVVISDLLWFGLCYRYGTRLLHLRCFKRLVHPRRLLEAKHQMERKGARMVAAARFVPGSRTTAITVAGILHLRPWKFATVTAACTLVTAPAQLALGWVGATVVGVETMAELLQLTVAMVILVVVLLWVLGVVRSRRLKGRLPRAKAAWLRRFRIRRGRPAEAGGRPAASSGLRVRREAGQARAGRG
jgi:membrane protein DedA with SNARE-associated domain